LAPVSTLTSSVRPEAGRSAIDANPGFWYHTIDLAPGLATPGLIDLRSCAAKVLPDDLTGKRVLDVATFDGFWAFEMERRGGEVIATDVHSVEEIEFPPPRRDHVMAQSIESGLELGAGFRLAAEALGSNVRRVECNVYDLSPAAIDGPVDFVLCGALLTHVRDPVRALERMRDVLVPGGEVRAFEPFSPYLTLLSRRRPTGRFLAHETDYSWWVPNLAGIASWLTAARLESVRRVAIARPRSSAFARTPYAAFSARRPR
jgi:tRNA (mo5U34)-methyltransferase